MNGGDGREEGLWVADAVQKRQVQPTTEAVENAQPQTEAEAKLKGKWKRGLETKASRQALLKVLKALFFMILGT